MKTTAAMLWEKLRDGSVESRAIEFAKTTLPYLMVDPMSGSRGVVEHDFQSAGALLVNNLAAKLARSLFPTGIPFFRSELTDAIRREADSRDTDITEVTAALARVDRKATQRLFQNASLAVLTQVIKLLIVTGNALLYRDSAAATVVAWSLRSYVVRRDATGRWMDIVLKQRYKSKDLDEEYKQDLMRAGRNLSGSGSVDLYTHVQRKKGTAMEYAELYHEIDGVRVGKEGRWPIHLCPYIVPTWNLAPGEHYGRGHVEDYIGDFAKLSLLSEKLGLYELESLEVLNLVDEAKGAVVDDYQDAEMGDYVPGGAEAVRAYERGDYNKMAAIQQSLQAVVVRLNQAFMYGANQRDAERVTAEEVRITAEEAENTLGGTYSLLAENLQSPLAYVCLSEVDDALLQGLITKQHKPAIETGLPALSRSAAVQSMLNASQVIAGLAPIAQLDPRISLPKMMDTIWAAFSVDTSQFYKSADELQAEAEQQRQQAAQAQAAQETLLEGASDMTNALAGV
ncbi:collar protein [Pseudomonas phage DL62]|uniref:Collar protein n=1 Tax=Pseudomonas phage DL62 TaxID=1640972 RepID=A0A0F6WDF4_9CAUD|nr:head-tail adaptor [Pseudomonas phage DL62]AKF13951.1 collar protein [Pseudomonas phage DL62]